jgi:hypothetical protein
MIRSADLAVTAALIAVAMSSACAAEGSGAASGARQIYRCEVAGVATFSDRPCGSVVQPYEAGAGLSVLESSAPEPSSKAVPHGRSAPASGVAAPEAAAAARAEVCRRLQQSLRKIAGQMRAGYKAKQGERLREQRRELQAKRRAQRC